MHFKDKDSSRVKFCHFCQVKQTTTRWAPTSYKWGEITPISRVITPVIHLFSAISCITGRGPPCTVKIEPFCTDLNVSPKRKDREITPLNLFVNQQSTCFRHQPSDHTVHPKFIYISKNKFGRELCDLQQRYTRHRHICTTSIYIYIYIYTSTLQGVVCKNPQRLLSGTPYIHLAPLGGPRYI